MIWHFKLNILYFIFELLSRLSCSIEVIRLYSHRVQCLMYTFSLFFLTPIWFWDNLFQSSNSSVCWSVSCMQLLMAFMEITSRFDHRYADGQVISTVYWTGSQQEKTSDTHAPPTHTLTHINLNSEQKSRQLQASFNLYRLRQLPEQVQAEYTPLTWSRGPRHQTGFSTWMKVPLNPRRRIVASTNYYVILVDKHHGITFLKNRNQLFEKGPMSVCKIQKFHSKKKKKTLLIMWLCKKKRKSSCLYLYLTTRVL